MENFDKSKKKHNKKKKQNHTTKTKKTVDNLKSFLYST